MPIVSLENIINNTQMKESFSKLRTNICFCGEDKRVIAVTSTFPNEGKSEISLRLACTFAEFGSRTILVDSDIRNSILQGKLGAFGISSGLSRVLAVKEETLDSAICKTSDPNLDIIFTGPKPPSPAELLSRDVFREILAELRERYEYVIVDCPPALPVIDASIITKECDATLMVIANEETRKNDIKKALKQLDQAGAHIIGAVLNKVKLAGGRYGYGYGYGYGEDS